MTVAQNVAYGARDGCGELLERFRIAHLARRAARRALRRRAAAGRSRPSARARARRAPPRRAALGARSAHARGASPRAEGDPRRARSAGAPRHARLPRRRGPRGSRRRARRRARSPGRDAVRADRRSCRRVRRELHRRERARGQRSAGQQAGSPRSRSTTAASCTRSTRPSGTVEVAVYPWDVSISREAPHDSALNHVRGPITSLVVIGNRARVQVGGLVGEVTAASAERLGLPRARWSWRRSRQRRRVSSSGLDVGRSVDSGRGRRDRSRVRALHRRGVDRARIRRGSRARRAGDRRAARARGDGGRGGRRSRRRGRPCGRRGRLGADAWHRALAAAARARRRDPREPRRARRARGAQRRQGDLVGQGRAAPGRRELPLLRLGDRDDRRPLEPDRRLAPLLLAEGAGRRRSADRARGTTR